MNLQPTGDRVLVARLEGHGIERVTKGGIVIPATTEARAKTKSDTWKGRVLALGSKAPTELVIGDVVLVHAWAEGDGSNLYTGEAAIERNHRFIRPDDIICIVDDNADPVAHPVAKAESHAWLREEPADAYEAPASKWLGDPDFATGGIA